MILLGLIGVFQNDYDGDIRLFLVNLVSKSNVIMILLLFVLLVTISLMHHLFALLLPYQEQKAHEGWVERTSRWLQIEEANMHTLAADMKKSQNERDKFTAQASAIANTRELLDSMKTEMAANRHAPKLLGVLTLNETLIQTIIGTITTAVTAFFSSFFTGILTEIGESSGFIPTAEPTMSPTLNPTAFLTTN